MLRIYNPRLLDYLRYQYTLDDVRRLTAFLREAGTFHFPALASGLHPAAHVSHDDPSGYASIWVRDNAHVAHAHMVDSRPEAAAVVVSGLAKFLATQRRRIQAVLDGENDASDPMHRPHIRFDGRKLAEIDERWAHAQNDGAFGANLAFDGQMSTEWSTHGDGDHAFVALDLGQVRALHRIGLNSRCGNYGSRGGAIEREVAQVEVNRHR